MLLPQVAMTVVLNFVFMRGKMRMTWEQSTTGEINWEEEQQVML